MARWEESLLSKREEEKELEQESVLAREGKTTVCDNKTAGSGQGEACHIRLANDGVKM
jgi:hypothetical protein